MTCSVRRLYVIALLLSLPLGRALGQSYDYENSYILGSSYCDPLSCQDTNLGGYPVLDGIFEVNFQGTCYPAPQSSHASFEMSLDPIVEVGIPTPCQPPGVYALAEVTYSTTNIPDDQCGDYYSIDYETATAEAYNAAGEVKFSIATTYGCDRSVSGPTQFGEVPC